jgi:hypothetical protein
VQEKVFKFTPRNGAFAFKLPTYLTKPAEVFRLDADGLHGVESSVAEG